MAEDAPETIQETPPAVVLPPLHEQSRARFGDGDLAWSGNAHFSRKEAAAAKRAGKGHFPMTPEMAMAIAADLIAGQSPKAIAARYGYAQSYAKRVVKAPDVQAKVRQQITKLMNEAGMDVRDQLKKLKQLQVAEKVVTASKDGIITDEKVYADNPVRLKAVETGLELHGAFPHKRQWESGETGPKFIINVAPEFKSVFFGADAAAEALTDGTTEVEDHGDE